MKKLSTLALWCVCVMLSGCAAEKAPADYSAEDSLSRLNICPVAFGVTADGDSIDNHTIVFNQASLGKTAPQRKGAVCYAPEKISPETLMKRLRIPTGSAKVADDSRTVYENGDYSLNVYKNGSFCLFSKAQNTEIKETSLSDEACIDIAESFLRENGLFCDDLVRSEELGEDKAVGEDKTIVVGKVVNYHPKVEGNGELFGNSRVSVRIAPGGRVTELIYNHLHYAKSAALPLLAPHEALRQAEAQNDVTAIYFETMSQAEPELRIDRVRVAYYENVMAEEPSRQPVYVFEGGSEESQFAVSVSALLR